MRFSNAYIPYRAYWSSPFCRWQGSLSDEHPVKLAAACARRMLDERSCNPASLDGVHFGLTVPQHQSFYGAPWFSALMGAPHITGPTISQACATSARVLASAGAAVSLASSELSLAAAADRISNGPHIYYPRPSGPGGHGISEDWVMDNFNNDPYAGVAMVQTAENVAAKFSIGREQQDELTVHRYQQYTESLASDRAFQKGYMQAVELRTRSGSRVVDADEGITESTSDGVAQLKPVLEGGTVTYAGQTHPADGNAGVLVGSREQTDAVSANRNIGIELVSYGEGRAEKAHMGMAPVPAAQVALDAAGIKIGDLAAIKTHNPFAVNDLYFARQTGFDVMKMNNYGSSLVFGHPQGPTGMRLVIELIEELVRGNGGYGLFTGCAAGDTAAAIVVKVG